MPDPTTTAPDPGDIGTSGLQPPRRDHPGLLDVPGRLGNLATELGVAVGHWAGRDTAADKAAAVRAGGDAVATIDEMLRHLHQAREQLVAGRRREQDRAMAESAELLQRLRAERGSR
jgi:hypothetical protein